MKRYALLVLLLLLQSLLPGDGAHAEQPPLAALYAPWYGYDYTTGDCRGGWDSMHWGTFWGTVYAPETGYYCSADPNVIRWQLDRVQEAGIGVLLVSWWGWGDTNLDGTVEGHPDAHMNRGIAALLDEVRASPIKVALIAEPFTLTQAGLLPNAAQQQIVLDWLWQHYYEPYSAQMFQWDGKPLLVSFDPMRLPADPRYTVRHWTGRPRGTETVAGGWQWFFAPPHDVIEGMSDDGVVFVYPRFDEWYLKHGGAPYITCEPRRIDLDLTQGLYDQQWQRVIENRGNVRLVVLYSWNLYGEQAHIEPSGQGPAPVGSDYVVKTRAYYDQLRE